MLQAFTLLHTLDGVNLADVADKNSKREYVFMQYQNKGEAIYTIITRQWKYAYSVPDNLEFLFDRINDPLETKNFAGINPHSETKQQLKQTITKYLHFTDEKDAVDGDDWRSYPRLEVPSDPDTGLIVQDHPWARITLPCYYTDKK